MEAEFISRRRIAGEKVSRHHQRANELE